MLSVRALSGPEGPLFHERGSFYPVDGSETRMYCGSLFVCAMGGTIRLSLRPNAVRRNCEPKTVSERLRMAENDANLVAREYV